MRMRAKTTGVLTAAGAGILLTMGTAPAAHATENAAQAAGTIVTFQYRNVQTGLCLDSDSKGNIYTKGCGSTNPYQQWERAESGGQVVLRNVATRRCLAKKDPFFNPTVLETNAKCTDTWKETIAGGKFRMLDNYSGNLALDSNAKGNVYLHEYGADNPYQQWNPALVN